MGRTRTRTRISAYLLTASLAAALVAGCALPRAEEPAVTDPVDPGAPPSEIATPAIPSDPEAVFASAELGEPAAAGIWTLTVLEAEYDSVFGDLSAERGELLMLDIDIANSSAADLMVSPSDFTVFDGTASVLPLRGDPGLTPERLVPAGATVGVSAVFEIPEEPAESSLELLFQPAEGDPVTIVVTVR